MDAHTAHERTLLVLFAPEATLGALYARRIVAEAGLAVTKQDKLSGEELEEAGLELGLGTGDGQPASPADASTLLHTAWIVEGPNATAAVRALRVGSLANECPSLRTFAAPSRAAADMAIEVLFPSLATASTSPAAEAASAPFPPAAAPAPPKPFALSNAAFEVQPESPPAAGAERKLSPAIERALAEVEAREEQQRLRKISRSSRGSSQGASSPLASREPSSTGSVVEPERRVFSLRTPSSDVALGVPYDEAEENVPDVTQGSISATDAVAIPKQLEQEPNASPALSRTSSVLSDHSATASLRLSTASTNFRARPAPSSTSKPGIQPRLTKAAALRLGLALPPPTPRRSTVQALATPATPQAAVAPTPRSLAAPAITPRMSKAAALRLGKAEPSSSSATATPRVRQSISTAERAAMDRARRQSAAAAIEGPSAATSKPRVEVRMSRAALLRQGLETKSEPARSIKPAGRASLAASTSGPVRVTSSTSEVPPSAGGRRSLVSADLKALREPSVAPRMTKAASLRASMGGAGPRLSLSSSLGTSSGGGTTRPNSSRPASSASLSSSVSRPPSSASGSGPGSVPPRRSLSVAATAAPSLAPRLNKAAELRRAMMTANTVPTPVASVKKATGGGAPVRKKALGEHN